ncbi:MAG TPA: methionyl-tRNA formyltransferase [Longimicrobiales bacterium]|nr:methionyl-tRNA formyltransferase [Longimicrobiales bacterium]
MGEAGRRRAAVRILFWGTPAFAVPSLRALDDEGFEIVGVVTQPDRPAGRGRRMTASPIKEVAGELGLELIAPERPRTEEFIAEIEALEPDLSVVVAYGHILTARVLDVPARGSINVHASLLPELRGAAPINWALIRGHQKTGVTVMRMVQAMDAGPVIHQVEEPILADETAAELSIRLSEVGAAALVEALALMAGGQHREVEQNHDLATYAPKVDRQTARVDWSRPAHEIGRLVRGMDDVPGAWTTLDGDPVKVFRPLRAGVAAAGGVGDSAPGTIVSANGGLEVATGDGALALGEVQPAGGRRMPAAAWVHGRRIEVGRRFE